MSESPKMSAVAERVMVIGGTGLVGNALVRAWRARGAEVEAATYHCHESRGFIQLDLQDKSRVHALLKEIRPDIVAVPAANPHVDYCEAHPAETRQVNVLGAFNVARACQETGARMIFFSSDYVFDGAKGTYTEEDGPCPMNEYGRQKVEAETGVLAADLNHLIVRSSGVYGWQWEPKNFVLQICAALSQGREMRVAKDILYNPTYVENLAEACVALAAAKTKGIFHVVGSEEIVRSDFAKRAAKAFDLNVALIKPVPFAELGSSTPRPGRSSLRTEKFRAAVGIPLLNIEQGLAAMRAMEGAWREYARTLPDSALKAQPPRPHGARQGNLIR